MPNWTDEQRAAIDEQRGALLVSAAAGSGKTAVLVERVLRRLTDPAQPADIDRLLLVTYTNAAAAEMRGKIADAITKRLSERPDDAHLRRQLLLVHRAQITTVHAFCLQLVREQFAALGLVPDFRIADEGETAEIIEDSMENVLEAGYESENEGFLALSDLLSAGRDDKKLSQVVLEVFQKIQSHADPDAFLTEVEHRFAAGADSAPHRAVLLEEAREAVQYSMDCLKLALAELDSAADLQAAYGAAFENDLTHAQHVLDAIQTGWDAAVAAAQDIRFDRLGSIRGYEDKAFQEYIKDLREVWKKAALRLQKNLLSVSSEEEELHRAMVSPAMGALVQTVRAFGEAFASEKLRHGVVDFGDLEHFAVRLLLKDGKPTPLASSVAAGFDEILVDEYQDTNAVQEAIFGAVSREGKNLFFVGDVKQSIYGFRLANPYIFLSKYRAWPDAEDAPDGAPRRLNLTRNFRSRVQVLDATNYIFRKVMCEAVGDLDYTDREALYVGADYPEPEHPRYKTEILLLDTESAEEDAEKTVLEAELAASRIQQLLREGFPVYDRDQQMQRPIQPSDIVILLRSISRKAAVYRQALEKIGLSAETDESTGLLSSSEVGAVVSMLHVIDNPRQDVELIGALRSPLWDFSEQELADIRLLDKQAEFYDVLTLSAQNGDAKAADFLRKLAEFRRLAADLPVSALVEQLYDTCGVLGLYGALPNGKQRQQNLMAFFERARAFEQNGSQGLFRFTALLRGMAERGEDWQAVHAKAGGGAVRIMSIHKSKGLEFPVVLLCDCAKMFNEQDLRAPVLVHPELGLGPKCRDLTRGVQYPTLWRQAITVQARREAVSEELRVLYVAMTRAKEKLIITASGAKIGKSLQKWATLDRMPKLPPYALAEMRSSLPWMLLPVLLHPAGGALRDMAHFDGLPDLNAPDVFEVRVVTPENLQGSAKILPQIAQETVALPPVCVDLPYDAPYLQDVPAKVTATSLKHSYKAAEAAEDTVPPRPEVTLRQPRFAQRTRGLTPAERGTAHHLFMQFCDFDRCTQLDGLTKELERLRTAHILSNEQADAVDLTRIARFFASSLYKNVICHAKKRREFKFSIVRPACDFFSEAKDTTEKVLLQGVIDCLLETPDGFIVIDFKTDRVTAEAAKTRALRYKMQLSAYASAVEAIFDRKVIRRIAYFLNCGEEVET